MYGAVLRSAVALVGIRMSGGAWHPLSFAEISEKNDGYLLFGKWIYDIILWKVNAGIIRKRTR